MLIEAENFIEISPTQPRPVFVLFQTTQEVPEKVPQFSSWFPIDKGGILCLSLTLVNNHIDAM
jgi:hypothetical protein